VDDIKLYGVLYGPLDYAMKMARMCLRSSEQLIPLRQEYLFALLLEEKMSEASKRMQEIAGRCGETADAKIRGINRKVPGTVVGLKSNLDLELFLGWRDSSSMDQSNNLL